VGGVDHFISAWKNVAQSSGKEYLKLAVTKKDGASFTKKEEKNF
jgi:hypothetical protein